MVPQSLVGVVLFMAFIAPGLAYEMLYEKRHPALEQSAFREAGRAVLTSLVFSAAAAGLLSLAHLKWPRFLFSPNEFARSGMKFAGDNLYLVVWAMVIHVGLALLLVILAHLIPAWIEKLPTPMTKWMPDWLCARYRGKMTSEGIWFDVFRKDVPRAAPRGFKYI